MKVKKMDGQDTFWQDIYTELDFTVYGQDKYVLKIMVSKLKHRTQSSFSRHLCSVQAGVENFSSTDSKLGERIGK